MLEHIHDYDDLDLLSHTEDVFHAVFTVNRHAKRLHEEADAAYTSGHGTEARAYSIQKTALYTAKTIAIHRLVRTDPFMVGATKHSIGGHTVWCFYFDDYAFHQPVYAVDPDMLRDLGFDDPAAVEAKEIEYTPSTDVDEPRFTLAEALHVLYEQDINANDYLDTRTVEDYGGEYFVSTEFPIQSAEPSA